MMRQENPWKTSQFSLGLVIIFPIYFSLVFLLLRLFISSFITPLIKSWALLLELWIIHADSPPRLTFETEAQFGYGYYAKFVNSTCFWSKISRFNKLPESLLHVFSCHPTRRKVRASRIRPSNEFSFSSSNFQKTYWNEKNEIKCTIA